MEGEKSVKERAEAVQRLVRGPLASSVESLNNLARGIPSGRDFFFFHNFEAFKRPVNSVLRLSEALLNDIGRSQSLWQRRSALPSEPEDSHNWFVDLQDDIFERVDASMDEFRNAAKEGRGGLRAVENMDSDFQMVYGKKDKRRIKKEAAAAAASGNNNRYSKDTARGGVKISSKDRWASSGRTYVPFHVPTITKPQDTYHIIVDNSSSPFQHKGLRKNEQGTGYVHPLLEELNEMAFFDRHLVPSEPFQPCPWDSTPFHYVETVEQLKDMAMKLQSSKEIAVDLEHNQYRSYQGITCLMQISTRTEDFVVDTLVLYDQIGSFLRDIFANPAITKVMHGSDRDIHWLQRDFGIFVCNLFDTGQASRVLNLERKSLEFLLRHYCGVTAEKEYQTADWRLRPLPTGMIKYARADTHYLLFIHDEMKQKLRSFESEIYEDPILEVYKRSRDICLQLYEKELLSESSFLHIYGLQDEDFTLEQLCVVAGLYDWRDNIARMEDESTGYILPNKLLLQIAKKMPRTTSALYAIVKGKHSYVDRHLAAVLEVIKCSKESKKNVVKNALDSASKLQIDGDNTEETLKSSDEQHLSSPDEKNVRNASTELLDGKEHILSGTSAEDKANLKHTNVISNGGKMDSCQQKLAEVVPSRKNEVFVKVGLARKSSLFKTKSEQNTKEVSTNCSDLNSIMLSGHVADKAGLSPLRKDLSSENNAIETINKVTKDAERGHGLMDHSQHPDAFVPDNLHTSLLDGKGVSTNETFLEPKDFPEVKLIEARGHKKSRGLAAMLGSSASKLRKDVNLEVHETVQDNVINKMEQIKASFTLPFLTTGTSERGSFSQAANFNDHSLGDSKVETLNIERTKFSSDVQAHTDSKVEVCMPVSIPSRDDEDDSKDANILGGTVTKDGKGSRPWWPLFEPNAGLPLSLKEIRRSFQKNANLQNSLKFVESSRLISHPSINKITNRIQKGKKEKTCAKQEDGAMSAIDAHSTENKEGSFKPFDYESATGSIGFSLKNEMINRTKGSDTIPKKRDKRKATEFDPMSRLSSIDDGIKSGKRRQVFPATGNRSATFR